MIDINLVKEWFKYAENDYISARHLFEDLWPKQLEISCYHCQQSAEKALKGYLIFKGISDPPWIHDLKILYKMCAEQDSDFYTISNQCADLTRYGIVSRYPNELNIDEIMTKSVLEKAKQVYDFCYEKVFSTELNADKNG